MEWILNYIFLTTKPKCWIDIIGVVKHLRSNLLWMFFLISTCWGQTTGWLIKLLTQLTCSIFGPMFATLDCIIESLRIWSTWQCIDAVPCHGALRQTALFKRSTPTVIMFSVNQTHSQCNTTTSKCVCGGGGGSGWVCYMLDMLPKRFI